MSLLLFFLASFIIVFESYNLFVIRKENALIKMKDSKELKLLLKIGKIDLRKKDLKKVVRSLAIGNSFIVAVTATLVILLKNYIDSFYLWLIATALFGFIILIPLIIFTYKVISKIIEKEG